MERSYNYIYEKLVKSDDDLIGLIAYGIYKKHKIEYIEDIKKKYDREPTQEECDSFFISSTTTSQLDKYTNDAESLLSDVVANTQTEEIKKYEKDMLYEYQNNIKKVLPPWWQNVLWSVIASFIFSALGLLAYHIGKNQMQDSPKQTIELLLKADSVTSAKTSIPSK